MPKRLMIVGCMTIAACLLGSIQSANADNICAESSFTVPAASTVSTNTVPLTAAYLDIDRIVVYNSGAVTAAVFVAAADAGVYTDIENYALAAGGGTNSRPRIVRSYSGSGSTNVYAWTARDLRFIVYKPTNATDVVVNWRVLGRQ